MSCSLLFSLRHAQIVETLVSWHSVPTIKLKCILENSVKRSKVDKWMCNGVGSGSQPRKFVKIWDLLSQLDGRWGILQGVYWRRGQGRDAGQRAMMPRTAPHNNKELSKFRVAWARQPPKTPWDCFLLTWFLRDLFHGKKWTLGYREFTSNILLCAYATSVGRTEVNVKQ